jgi:hypothetical protein
MLACMTQREFDVAIVHVRPAGSALRDLEVIQ